MSFIDNILPRKYNNKVVIGLIIALGVSVGVAIYLYMREPTPKPSQPPTQQPGAHTANTQKPAHNIETRVGESKPCLLLIWAGWCGWSQKMKPTWDKVASILSKDGAIDTIDLSDENNKEEIAKARPNIPEFKGYPHIRFYPDGYSANKPSVAFDGNPTEEDILKFAYQQFGS